MDSLLRRHPLGAAIVLFVILFAITQSMRPRFFYQEDGSLRDFGVGYRNKTILPVWLFSLLLAILCYVAVLYYIYHVHPG
jgi:Trk-type K+ transport system membrane component